MRRKPTQHHPKPSPLIQVSAKAAPRTPTVALPVIVQVEEVVLQASAIIPIAIPKAIVVTSASKTITVPLYKFADKLALLVP